mmetsp:Transcript_6351/g.25750  ORF Transcript_6351/g.25750 Transcript_6351/m.25750 type:complete len:204 (+) Transcript_6351:1435-2046(+)
MTSGNLAVSARTNSHAPRRRVSESLPSMSRRTYSTWLVSNSSSSSAVNVRLGITMDSHTCLNVSPPANSEWCTELATAVRNFIPEVTRWSFVLSKPVFVSRTQTSCTNVFKNRWNSSSFFSMYKFTLSQMAALTASEGDPSFKPSSATFSYAKRPWNAPIHLSMSSSNTSGSSCELSEKKIRHTKRMHLSKETHAGVSLLLVA